MYLKPIFSLEKIKLSYIELKKHVPKKMVSEHCIQTRERRYTHEGSNYHDVFRGVKRYREIIQRVQKLPTNL